MKLQPVYIIEELEQLKTISDPLRARVLLYLIEKAYTGQQLAKLLGMARAKVHYHLNELERHNLIFVVRTELKNGIVQKFYRAVARGFVPSENLLPYVSEVENYYRERTLSVLGHARNRAINAPEEAFQIPSPDRSQWPIIMTQVEAKMSKAKFTEWVSKFRALIYELDAEQEEDGEWFYLTTVGFQTHERGFDPIENVTESASDATEEER